MTGIRIDIKKVIAALAALMLVFTLTACGGGDQASESSESAGSESAKTVATELDQEGMDSLMQQVADKEVQKNYKDVLPDEVFADAEILGLDNEGDKGTAYVYLDCSEFVKLKDKTYEMSGSAGEAIVRFTYTEDGPVLDEVEWSADGSDHDKWIEENFPEEYYKEWKAYDANDENGKPKLAAGIYEKVEKAMGAPVEQENLLNIDTDKGTYEIVKVIESGEGEDYSFDTETIENGKLSDL